MIIESGLRSIFKLAYITILLTFLMSASFLAIVISSENFLSIFKEQQEKSNRISKNTTFFIIVGVIIISSLISVDVELFVSYNVPP